MTIISMPIADQLAAVAAYGLPTQTGRAAGPLDDTAWRELTTHVQWQRITHTLARAVTAEAPHIRLPATDSQIADAVRADEAAIAGALRLEHFLLDLGTLLDGHGVPFRVLKGPAVAHLDYPDPVWRSFGDIDLLIRAADLDHVISVLISRGFTRRFPQPRKGFDRRFTKSVSLSGPNGEEVDLHRTLTTGGFGQRIVVPALWDGPPSSFELGGRTLLALGPEERFLHACYHAVLGNVPPRLAPLRDIAEMLIRGGLDTGRTLRLAAQWQGEAVLAHAITTTLRTLSVALNDPLLEWASRFIAPRRRQQELDRATSPGYTFPAQAVDSLRAIRGVRERVAYGFALAFPDRSYIRGRHPGFTARARHALSDVRHVRTHRQGDQP